MLSLATLSACGGAVLEEGVEASDRRRLTRGLLGLGHGGWRDQLRAGADHDAHGLRVATAAGVARGEDGVVLGVEDRGSGVVAGVGIRLGELELTRGVHLPNGAVVGLAVSEMVGSISPGVLALEASIVAGGAT